MGLALLMLFTATLLVVRNQRILAAWNAWQEETQRRAAAGLPPKTRKRRRKTLAGLAAGEVPRPRQRHDHEPALVNSQDNRHNQAKHALTPAQTRHQAPAPAPRPQHQATSCQEAGISDPNVKIGPTER